MIKSKIIQGIARIVEKIKNPNHPKLSAKIPALADKKLREKLAKDDNNEYWVALNVTLHKLLKYATKTESPIPPLEFSINITK
jgi:hypothetical protein